MNDAAEYLENEWYVVRHSGEMPEVALHASLHYLTEAKDGPGLSLADHHLRELQAAALERYREIILRDLVLENRDTAIYRGVKRSIINYQRCQRFCRRQGLAMQPGFSEEIAAALRVFLAAEVVEVTGGARDSSINCSYRELELFAAAIGVPAASLPPGLEEICPAACPSGEIAIV